LEALLILVALGFVIGLPVAVIVLLVGQSRLSARSRALEAEVAQLGRQVELLSLHGRPAAAPVAENPWGLAPVSPPEEAEAPVEPATPDELPASDPADHNRPLVIRRDRFGQLAAWLRLNWVYSVSAFSLALAGIFLVQYGIEAGLLPPVVRVMLALLFGAALIAAGEAIRRRHWQAAVYLPDVFSGAGLVSVFGGVVSGRIMYALYGEGVAFAGLMATAALAVLLGWRNGPFLAAIGLIGAAVAPFLVAGTAQATPLLYGHYLLITAVGLTVDAVRRWAWISVLALVLGYGGGFLMYLAGAGAAGWITQLVLLVLAATALPVLRLIPDHAGPPVALAVRTGRWPPFPVRLAAGAILASALALTLLVGRDEMTVILAFAALTALALVLLLWADRAPGLDDLAALPVLGLLAKLALEGWGDGPLASAFRAEAIALRAPETSAPWTVTWLAVMATLVTLAAAWRALSGERYRIGFGLAAVVIAPVALLLLELFWQPAPVLGPYPWALHAMMLAGLMVGFALRFARADADDRRRFAYATISALSLIALSLFLLTTSAALTLALAVLMVVTAAMDRRFDLPELGWFLQLGVAVLGWRLTVDPGIGWALAAPLPGVVLAFVGVIGATLASLYLLRPRLRLVPLGVLESAAAGFTALFANVLITRWLGHNQPVSAFAPAHELTLNALPWLILMLVQLYRLPLGGPLRALRAGIAAVAGALATLGLLAAVTLGNPLVATGAMVRGPLVLDTLLVAYGLPGLILLAAAARLPGLAHRLRAGFLWAGAALTTLYAGLEIRRFWQGDVLSGPGVTQPELYSYTVAMMLVGAALLYQAIARRAPGLRRVGMAVIAVTVAKVFLIDAAGLTGLTRVASFLGLGLSLAGLAWLNRWVGGSEGNKA
jgi:uncharacterized membrane protein